MRRSPQRKARSRRLRAWPGLTPPVLRSLRQLRRLCSVAVYYTLHEFAWALKVSLRADEDGGGPPGRGTEGGGCRSTACGIRRASGLQPRAQEKGPHPHDTRELSNGGII